MCVQSCCFVRERAREKDQTDQAARTARRQKAGLGPSLPAVHVCAPIHPALPPAYAPQETAHKGAGSSSHAALAAAFGRCQSHTVSTHHVVQTAATPSLAIALAAALAAAHCSALPWPKGQASLAPCLSPMLHQQHSLAVLPPSPAQPSLPSLSPRLPFRSPLPVEPHRQHCLAEGQVPDAAARRGVDNRQPAGRQECLVTCVCAHTHTRVDRGTRQCCLGVH